MKMNFFKIIALTLVILMIATACAPANVPSDSDAVDPVTTEVVTTEGDTSEVATTEAPDEEKKVKNILMIGNSFCYYYVEELCGIAAADGYDLNVANLYASGAWLNEHWKNYLSDEEFYDFYVTNKRRVRQKNVTTVKSALSYAKEKLGGDWDVITLQQNNYYSLIGDAEKSETMAMPYAKNLYDVIKKQHPEAKLYWHQSWSYEIGFGQDKADVRERVTTEEHRTSMYELAKDLSYKIAEKNDVKLVPTGDAWEIARKNDIIGTTLCARLGVNNDLGDYYHEGDIGGGQYLNACVWYEVLMGESCIGNTWRPTYELSEEKIAILQAAAHEAVAAVYGEDYAK